jgi:protein gp37
MGDKSSIEWTDATWNPVTGCDRVSAGCDHCYALDLAARLKAMGQPRYQKDGDPKTSGPGFGVTMHPDKLTEPLRWTKPRRIFVNSMSDLFHAEVEDWFIASVFAVMAATPHHTYQILTKRPQRMVRLLANDAFLETVRRAHHATIELANTPSRHEWPLPNVWLGVSVENQAAAWRIDWLAKTPAAVRFLSIEPMIGPVDIEPWLWLVGMSTAGPFRDKFGNVRIPRAYGLGGQAITSIPAGDIHWVITGGESGPDHRPFDPAWAMAVRDQCHAAGVAYFHKQNGGKTPKAGGRELDGRTWDEFPIAQGAH